MGELGIGEQGIENQLVYEEYICVKTRYIYKEIYLILDFRSEWIVTYLIFFSKLQNFIP